MSVIFSVIMTLRVFLISYGVTHSHLFSRQLLQSSPVHGQKTRLIYVLFICIKMH